MLVIVIHYSLKETFDILENTYVLSGQELDEKTDTTVTSVP